MWMFPGKPELGRTKKLLEKKVTLKGGCELDQEVQDRVVWRTATLRAVFVLSAKKKVRFV